MEMQIGFVFPFEVQLLHFSVMGSIKCLIWFKLTLTILVLLNQICYFSGSFLRIFAC